MARALTIIALLAAAAVTACDDERQPTVDCGPRGEVVELDYCACDPGYLSDGTTCVAAAAIVRECAIPEGWPPLPDWALPDDAGVEEVIADQDPLLGACICPPEPEDWEPEDTGTWSCPCDNGWLERIDGVDYCVPEIP